MGADAQVTPGCPSKGFRLHAMGMEESDVDESHCVPFAVAIRSGMVSATVGDGFAVDATLRGEVEFPLLRSSLCTHMLSVRSTDGA